MTIQKYIEINPKVMAGKPVIAGTRIPVELILKKLAQNTNIDDLLKEYPRLTKNAVKAVLFYAGNVVGNEDIYPLNA